MKLFFTEYIPLYTLPSLCHCVVQVRNEFQSITKKEYQEIKAMMDAEDPRIAVALEIRFVRGISVEEVSVKFKVSPPRVYPFFTHAREIGRKYMSKIK